MRIGSVVRDDILDRFGIVVLLDTDIVKVIWSDGNSHWAWEHHLELVCK